MNAPVEPAMLAVALVPTIVFFGMAYWRFKVQRAFSLLTVIAFASSAALVTLVIVVSATYAFGPLSAARGSLGLVAAPLLAYTGTLVALGRISKLSAPGLLVGAAVGLVPLYFVGFYAWLLAACSFGECL